MWGHELDLTGSGDASVEGFYKYCCSENKDLIKWESYFVSAINIDLWMDTMYYILKLFGFACAGHKDAVVSSLSRTTLVW